MKRLAGALLTIALASRASAYQREEHYFSLSLALTAAKPVATEPVVAMCAQLADEAPELNPIESYRRMMRRPFAYLAWSMRSRGADEPVGRMVTVQQLQHVLTGGSAEAAHAIAADLVAAQLAAAAVPVEPAARADALCALGFALHFYGDSYAHRRIYNPRRMYPTGLGHLFDGAAPDLPLYNPARLALWKEYLGSFSGVLPGFDKSKLDNFLTLSEQTRGKARETNSYGRDALRRVEREELERLGGLAAPLERAPSKLRCQDIVDGYAAKHGLKAAPNCERAWALHRDAAEAAFAKYENGPDGQRAPAREVRRPFYHGPIFDGGSR